MWRAKQQRRAELRIGLDDRTKDAMMLGAIVVVSHLILDCNKVLTCLAVVHQTIGAFVAQTYFTRREALQAQHERAKYKFTSTKDLSHVDSSKSSLGSDEHS